MGLATSGSDFASSPPSPGEARGFEDVLVLLSRLSGPELPLEGSDVDDSLDCCWRESAKSTTEALPAVLALFMMRLSASPLSTRHEESSSSTLAASPTSQNSRSSSKTSSSCHIRRPMPKSMTIMPEQKIEIWSVLRSLNSWKNIPPLQMANIVQKDCMGERERVCEIAVQVSKSS